MIVVIIIVLVVVIGGGYALFHKTPYKAPAAAATTSPASTTTTAVLVTKSSASLGQYLATSNGQPLYTYDGDSKGVSNCTGSCLASWPAYEDKGSTTDLPANVGTIKRTDNGAVQFTYNGMPLYTFVGDSNGQVTGNGVSNFTIAKPATASATTAPTSTPAPSQSTTSTSSTSSNSSSSGSGW